MSGPTLKTIVFLFCAALAVAPRAAAQQTPQLWRDPGAIAEKDLRWGVGSADRQPVAPYTFVKEDLSGSKPKIRITDANGVTWNVKFGGPEREKNEVHPEVAANRLAFAVGYFVEEDYYVAEGRIEGIQRLERADSAVSRDGRFRVARFERRDPSIDHSDTQWSLDANPFTTTPELSGLKILLALVNNWDNKRENTGVDRVTLPDGTIEERYLLTDWGASFGRMSGPPDWAPAPTRWRVDHFKSEPLIEGVGDGVVKLHYRGQVPIESVPLEHAKWFSNLVAQLRPEQVRAAFEAAGATAADAEAFAARVIEKIEELKSAVGASH